MYNKINQKMDNRLKREQEFHDQRFAGEDIRRKAVSKYYEIAKKAQNKYEAIILDICSEKKILEYGCGAGENSIKWIDKGACVVGIDISNEAIKKAEQRAISNQSHKKSEYYVRDAENTGFSDEEFDGIVGSGIIHHLNIDNSVKEINRILKKGGTAVFIEPLGHNIFINYFRKKTPNLRSVDEHPLLEGDISKIKENFEDVHCHYFCLLSFISLVFARTGLYNTVYNFTSFLDMVLFSVMPFMRKNAWLVVVKMKK